MGGMAKIVDKKNITISEAKVFLEKIENSNQFQIRTLEYAKKFSKIDSAKVSELLEALMKQFEIERSDAIQVANCMPTSIEELRVFFSAGRKRLIVTSQLGEMLKLLDKYR